MLIFTEDEKILTSDSGTGTELLLSLGSNKSILISVNIEQFSIANVRIFYKHLISSRFPSINDVRDYLSYSIKSMSLLAKAPENLACNAMTSTEYCSICMVSHGVLIRAMYISLLFCLAGQKNYLQGHNKLAKIFYLVQLPPSNLQHTH